MSGKLLRLLFMSLAIAVGLPALAWGQWVSAPYAVANSGDRDFNYFLNSHPDVANDLLRNPGLVDNASYLYSHPGLRDFLAGHPYVREEFRRDPRQFAGWDRRGAYQDAALWHRDRDDWRDREESWRREQEREREREREAWLRDHHDHDRDDWRWRDRDRDRDHDHDRWRDHHDRDRDHDHDHDHDNWRSH